MQSSVLSKYYQEIQHSYKYRRHSYSVLRSMVQRSLKCRCIILYRHTSEDTQVGLDAVQIQHNSQLQLSHYYIL